MQPNCAICADVFDEVISIVAIPCGHVFHEICLLQWFEQSLTCPTCRKRITKKGLVKLFFATQTDFSCATPVTSSSDNHKREILSLREKLDKSETNLKKAVQDAAELRQQVSEAEANIFEITQRCVEESEKGTVYQKRIKDLAMKKDQFENLRSKYKQLMQDMESMKSIRLIIAGTQADVDDILEANSRNPDSLKQLATYCSLLKREMMSMSDSKQKAIEEISRLRTSMVNISIQVQDLKRERDELKESNREVKEENDSLYRKLKEVSLNKTVEESPAPDSSRKLNRTANENTPLAERPTKKLKFNQVNLVAESTAAARPSYHQASSSTRLQLNTPKMISSRLQSTTPKIFNTPDSIIRQGYNGMGGHSKHINNSFHMTFARPKKGKHK